MSNAAWQAKLATAIRAALIGNATVAGYVSARVYPGDAGQDPTYAYIVYHCPLSDRTEHLLGSNDVACNHVTFQIDYFTKTYTDGVGLGDAIFQLMDGKVLTVTGWGSPRCEGAGGGPPEAFYKDGERYWRGFRRYRALLAKGT